MLINYDHDHNHYNAFTEKTKQNKVQKNYALKDITVFHIGFTLEVQCEDG